MEKFTEAQLQEAQWNAARAGEGGKASYIGDLLQKLQSKPNMIFDPRDTSTIQRFLTKDSQFKVNITDSAGKLDSITIQANSAVDASIMVSKLPHVKSVRSVDGKTIDAKYKVTYKHANLNKEKTANISAPNKNEAARKAEMSLKHPSFGAVYIKKIEEIGGATDGIKTLDPTKDAGGEIDDSVLIELDIAVEPLEKAKQVAQTAAKKFNCMARLRQAKGPGGGWPVFAFMGQRKDVAKLKKHLGY